MRILFMSWEYPPNLNGGLGQHVKDLVPTMLAIDPELELHVVTPTFGEQTNHERLGRLHVHRVAALTPADDRIYHDVVATNTSFLRAIEELMAAGGSFDLVHVHDWLPSFAALALRETVGVPLITTIHATERGRYRGALHNEMSWAIDAAEGRLARQAQRVIACSAAMQREVCSFFDVPVEQLKVIPNGIDGSRFRKLASEDLSAFRRLYARPDERIVFHVGRLVYEKGADLLVETAPLVLSRVPDTRFVIGGRGPLFASLSQRIEAMHLHDKVQLTGFLADEERDRLYAVADVCVFPSRYEPFGIVALEAMAAGTPVVVSDVGGLGTVVHHEQTGLTTYPEDVNSLAWAIVRALTDRQAAAERTKRAMTYLETCLAWPVIARMTLDVYHEVLEAREV